MSMITTLSLIFGISFIVSYNITVCIGNMMIAHIVRNYSDEEYDYGD